jgi:hypothetical protein
VYSGLKGKIKTDGAGDAKRTWGEMRYWEDGED